MASSLRPPAKAISLLAADRAVQNVTTGRFDLYGVFHALNLDLPTDLAFVAYYSLTSVFKPFELELCFLGPDDERLGGGTVFIPVDDPTLIVQSMNQVYLANITHPGIYRLRMEACNEVLAETPIMLGHGSSRVHLQNIDNPPMSQ